MMKILVGLSGGVDSAVACKLLLDAGFYVEAAFMKNWEEDDTQEVCSAEQDLKDAQSVANNLGIKLHTVNFAHEYWERVFKYFLSEYKAGRTPNPDVLCNKEIKFHEFLNFALDLGFDYIATGHYARIKESEGKFDLLRGKDNNKDQSYFLHLLNQQQLAKAMFPLGDLEKPTIRKIAQESGFSVAEKKDSTGICFIGERNFRTFLKQYMPAQPGIMRTENGTVVGEHIGLMYYTLGQRKGLNIGGHKDFAEAPWYVLAKNMKNNELIVGQNPQDKLLSSREATILNPHWINKTVFNNLTAKTRYRQNDSSCELISVNHDSAIIKFDEDQFAVTPGQSLVLYQGNICLGGGVIC